VPRLCFGCNAPYTEGEEQFLLLCRNHTNSPNYNINAENPVDRYFFTEELNIIKGKCISIFYRKRELLKSLIPLFKYRKQEQIGSFFRGIWYGHILKENNFLNQIGLCNPRSLHRKN